MLIGVRHPRSTHLERNTLSSMFLRIRDGFRRCKRASPPLAGMDIRAARNADS